MVVVFNINANDNLFREYNILHDDLRNFDVSGYKSSWDVANNMGDTKIDFSQAALMTTGNDTTFGIAGEGFFKILLENDMIGYTRYGYFYMWFGDSGSEFTLTMAGYDYRLYDPINIPSNTVNLRLEGNILYAFLTDGTKIETGQINVYKIDEEKLVRYKDSIFITVDNYNSQTINPSRIITGCVEMSNVRILETLLRMHNILWDLKNYGYNYDNIDQILLMLINNIPILNELSRIEMRLTRDEPQNQFMFTDLGGLSLLKSCINSIGI
jgi:flagellar basal body rod protein FlgF